MYAAHVLSDVDKHLPEWVVNVAGQPRTDPYGCRYPEYTFVGSRSKYGVRNSLPGTEYCTVIHVANVALKD